MALGWRKGLVMRRALLLLVTALSFQSLLFAEEKSRIEDKIIGSTFKTLAKAFVVTVDINKLKQVNIDKIKRIDEEKFRKRYIALYRVVKDLPFPLKASYKITEHMTKEQAEQIIDSLDKQKIYRIIDAVPDRIIVDQFRQYLGSAKQKLQRTNIVEQINKLWNKIIKKANQTTS